MPGSWHPIKTNDPTKHTATGPCRRLSLEALACILKFQPKVIVLDAPTSMLDVITQAQMMALLKDYQSRNGTAYLLISHDRMLCEQRCDRLYYVCNGRFTEE